LTEKELQCYSKLGKGGRAFDLRIIKSICKELQWEVEDVVEIRLWDCFEIYNLVKCMDGIDLSKKWLKDWMVLKRNAQGNICQAKRLT